MNILFDLEATQPNASGKYHGGGKYGEIIINRIIERNLPISVFYNSTKWINPELLSKLRENKIKMYDCSIITLNEIVKNNDIDKIYTPLLSQKTLMIESCKVVATIHGLRELELPVDLYRTKYSQERNLKTILINFLYYHFPEIKQYRLKRHLKDYYLFRNKVDFVTVSYHSAFSIKSFFPELKFDTNKVFYSPSTITESAEDEENEGENYFLLVSGNRWEKNNLRALIALDELYSEGMLKNFKVVITGATSVKDYKYKFQNQQNFSFVGYVDDKKLSQLYKNAYCLIYPSLNEGFGYPPLEAMSNGVPVIASSYSSIQEVCSYAALYVNPMSIYEIKNRINMILTPDMWDKYSSYGRKRHNEIIQKQNSDLDKLIDYIYQRI